MPLFWKASVAQNPGLRHEKTLVYRRGGLLASGLRRWGGFGSCSRWDRKCRGLSAGGLIETAGAKLKTGGKCRSAHFRDYDLGLKWDLFL